MITWTNTLFNRSIRVYDQCANTPAGIVRVLYDRRTRTWYAYVKDGPMIAEGHHNRESAKNAVADAVSA